MNILSITETATQARNSTRLFRWAQDARNEGHSITQITLDASVSVTDVAARIHALAPDHVQIWGKVAIPSVTWDPDGHIERAGSIDCVYATDTLDGWGFNSATDHFEGVNGAWGFWPTAAVRSVSRVYFDDMSNVVPDPGAAIDAYLDRNHDYRTGAYSYSPRAALVCYLDYLFAGLTNKLTADLTDVVGGAIDNLDFTNVDDAYHWFTVNAGKSFLAGALFDGGISRGGDDGGIGEYNIGSEHDFASGKVQTCALMLFCSWAWQWDVWPLMRAALAGGSQFVWYNAWGGGTLSGWDEQTPIGKIVQRAHTQYSQSLATGIGDGTLRRMIGDDMSQADFLAFKAEMEAFKTQVIAAVPALQTVGPAPLPGNALASASMSASSTYLSGMFPLSNLVDGDHKGANWGKGAPGGGWNDGQQGVFPKWVEFDFPQPVAFSQFTVTTLQDNLASPIEPTDATTFSLYGVTAFDVLGWDGSKWQTLASVTGNRLVKRTVTFASFTSSKFRLVVNTATDGYARLVEVEAS